MEGHKRILLSDSDVRYLSAHDPCSQCFNFLSLAKSGYYDDTVFHRLIPGFMVQGGDPTGTGRGGESIWGRPFRDEIDAHTTHDARGVLSMANKGAGTNGSQFFFTFRATPHLNGKHTVFGRLVGEGGKKSSGEKDATLAAIEKIPTEAGTNKPLRSVRILDAAVFDDPFEKFKDRLEQRLKRENMTDEERLAKEAKRKAREDDRTTWLGTNLAERNAGASSLTSATGGVGKYLGAGGASKASPSGPGLDSSAPATKKRKGADGFGDFSSW